MGCGSSSHPTITPVLPWAPVTYSDLPLPAQGPRTGARIPVFDRYFSKPPVSCEIPKSVHIVYNPNAGTRGSVDLLAQITAALPNVSIASFVHATQRVGHGVEIAASMKLTPQDCVLVIGGDGTLHEVVNGLSQREGGLSNLSNIPVVCVPGGSNCVVFHDLVTEFKVATNPRFASAPVPQAERALGSVGGALQNNLPLGVSKLLTAGHSRVMDVATVTSQKGMRTSKCTMVSLAYVGLVSDVADSFEGTRACCWFLGTNRTQPLAAYELMFGFKPHILDLTLDGVKGKVSAAFVGVHLNKTLSTGMIANPAGVADDGLMEVVVCQVISRLKLLDQMALGATASHVFEPNISVYRCKTVKIEGAMPYPIRVDGEKCGTLPMEISVVNSALRTYCAKPETAAAPAAK